MIVALWAFGFDLGEGSELVRVSAYDYDFFPVLAEPAYHFGAFGAGVAAFSTCHEYFLLLFLG